MIKFNKIFNDSKIFDCFTGLVATVCKYNNWHFECMFANCWNTTYNFEEYKVNKLIGGNFNTDININENLERYYGIILEYHDIKNEIEYKDNLQNYIINEEPVIIIYDTFWCNWLKDYKIIHSNHASLVCGKDKDNNLICIDAIPYGVNLKFSWSDLEKSIYGYIIVKKIKNVKKIEYKDFIKDQYEKMFIPENTYFKNIYNLACLIGKEFDIQKEKETNKTQMFYKINFIIDIQNIVRCKRGFALCIEQFMLENNDKLLLEFYAKLLSVSDNWYMLWLISIKYFMINKLNVKEALKDKFMEIISMEKECIRVMKKIINLNKFENDEKINIFCNENKKNLLNCNYKKLNLEKFFNNKAISNCIENYDNADFTSTGQYFVCESKKYPQIYKYNDFHIVEPSYEIKKFDNIICDGQVIILNTSKIFNILVIGCCEYGDHYAKFKIKFCDGSFENIKLGFSDWKNHPKFGEKIAFHYQGAQNGILINEDLKLFINIISVNSNKNILSLQLPYLANMHIFDIYIVKRK